MKSVIVYLTQDEATRAAAGTLTVIEREIKPQPPILIKGNFTYWSMLKWKPRPGIFITASGDDYDSLCRILQRECPYPAGTELVCKETWKCDDPNGSLRIIYKAGGYKLGVDSEIFHNFAHYVRKWFSPVTMKRYDVRFRYIVKRCIPVLKEGVWFWVTEIQQGLTTRQTRAIVGGAP